jgi:outer membrane lipoprotein-sorting protein
VERFAVKRALLLAALAAAATGWAQDALTPEALMRQLAASGAATVAFTETRHSSALSAPLVARGELSFTPPARLERSVTAPVAERYIVAGDRVTIERRGAAPRTLSLAAQPVLGAFLESIRATLRGDLAALARHYRVEVEGSAARWSLVLLPSDPGMAEYVTVIRIAGTHGRLTGMEVVETGGDRVVSEFAEVAR